MFSLKFRPPPGMKREQAMRWQLLRITFINFAIWGVFFGLFEYGVPIWNYTQNLFRPHRYIEPIFLLDARDPICLERVSNYSIGSHHNVSIIIPYLNESWALANKTLRSILQTTPDHLINEILLIDDGNEPGNDSYDWGDRAVSLAPNKIKVHRNGKREGLIRSKNVGAALSSAETLVFLEPHMIFNPGWLEPLLDGLDDGHTIVAPHLDSLTEDYFLNGTTGYMLRPYTIGGFDFSFTFNWFAPPSSRDPNWETPDNFYTPAFSGGVFAVKRDEFFRFGGFDNGMEMWGGENVEMSLKIWMCGGTIVSVPCSRTGHMFRGENPYYVDELQMARNQKRAAAMWLGEYEYMFSKYNLNAERVHEGSLQVQIQWGESFEKQHGKCKDIKWFIKTVYPDLVRYQPFVVEPAWLKYNFDSGWIDFWTYALPSYVLRDRHRPRKWPVGNLCGAKAATVCPIDERKVNPLVFEECFPDGNIPLKKNVLGDKDPDAPKRELKGFTDTMEQFVSKELARHTAHDGLDLPTLD